MSLAERSRKVLLSIVLVLVLVVSTACSAAPTADRTSVPTYSETNQYSELSRGNTARGQDFGQWVTQTAQGVVTDAYVRNDDSLGVVISDSVRPNEVRPLARSLVEGFRKNFPNRDLKVLVYAPDKKLILTANYDNAAQQIEYK